MRIQHVLLAVVLTLGVTGLHASEPHCQPGVGEDRSTTPSGRFERPGNGTVNDRMTGLQWTQCALGQNWSRDACGGQALAFTWDNARLATRRFNDGGGLAGYTDWRLPTREELAGIVEHCREAPSINTRVFPDTPWAGFWSSEESRDDPNDAWFVGFYYGVELAYNKNSSYRVRLVRIP